jgi:predicted GTPase
VNQSQFFYQELAKLQQEFASIGDEAKQRMDKMQALIAKLANDIHQQRIDNKLPLAELLLANLASAKIAIAGFEQATQQHMFNTKFRDEFSDSLLVFVYGKVNAGKSSLGNLVAMHPASKTKAQFFRYDEAGKARHQAELEELKAVEGFETKETEATSSIQGFRLPALSWIDTPGLHSMTPVNGKLAQDYIDAADIVLYVTSSDSPGRSTDAQEITDLITLRAKKVCVLLTKSDVSEEDEVDGELVAMLKAKSPQVRAEQEQWVKQQLKDYLKQEASRIGDVISMSVLLAKNGDWQASNLDVFYRLLNSQALKHAKALKQETPRLRFNSLLTQTLQGQQTDAPSLQQIKHLFEQLEKRAYSEGQQLLAAQQTVWESIETELRGIVSNIVDKHAASKNTAVIKNELETAFPELVKQHLMTEISQHIQQFNDNLPLSLQLNQAINLTDKTESLSYTVSHSGKGAAAGALAGFLLGGPVGAMLGGLAGGAAGGAFNERKRKTIILGDNREEVISALLKDIEQEVNKMIQSALQQVHQGYFLPVEALAKNLLKQIILLQKDLIALQYPSVGGR